jgi:hypothetical protein
MLICEVPERVDNFGLIIPAVPDKVEILRFVEYNDTEKSPATVKPATTITLFFRSIR